MVIPKAKYTATVKTSLAKLKSQGTQTRVKNFWKKGDPYQGINVALTTSKGVKAELQFHTTESLKVKNVIHHDYEKFRVSSEPSLRKSLWDTMTATADKIPVPENVLDIPDLKVQTLT
jgi:hypothetical protein